MFEKGVNVLQTVVKGPNIERSTLGRLFSLLEHGDAPSTREETRLVTPVMLH